jgi:hypothetical protein
MINGYQKSLVKNLVTEVAATVAAAGKWVVARSCPKVCKSWSKERRDEFKYPIPELTDCRLLKFKTKLHFINCN